MRNRSLARVVTVSIAAATLLTGIATLGAGSASARSSAAAPVSAPALLCGYPLKKCPAGQTNPLQNTTLGPGYLLISQATAAKTPQSDLVLAYPSHPIDYLDVSTSEPFSAYVINLPRNSTVLASVVLPSGKLAPIGIVKTNSVGRAILPAMRFSRPGMTQIALRRQDGVVEYIYIRAN